MANWLGGIGDWVRDPTGGQGWLDYAIDKVLGGASGPEPRPDAGPGTIWSPTGLFEKATSSDYFPGTSLDRVIFPPHPIRPSVQDVGIGMLGAILANAYNRKRPPAGQPGQPGGRLREYEDRPPNLGGYGGYGGTPPFNPASGGNQQQIVEQAVEAVLKRMTEQSNRDR